MSYKFITAEQKERVALLTLNRPKQLNALNPELMQELGQALQAADADAGIGAIVITGHEKAFAAGADIGVMKDYGYMDDIIGAYNTRVWALCPHMRQRALAAAS